MHALSDHPWIYLDHASTSRPKAPGVLEAMAEGLGESCASPGRGTYALARNAERIVHQVRERVAQLTGTVEADQVLFTAGATEALNLALHGLLSRGDHVIATNYDHNAVLRPVAGLAQAGVSFSSASLNLEDSDATVVATIEQEVRVSTKMVVINHASNVTGEELPAIAIGSWARARGLLVLLDAAQSIGHLDINVNSMPFDAVAFGAHKGLRGPFGVGCLVMKDIRIPLKPLLRGGTGLESESIDPRLILPTAFEVGTLNMPAIAGLGAAIDFLSARCAQESHRALDLASDCAARLRKLPNLSVYGLDRRRGVPNVAFNVNGVLPERVASELDARFRIAVRAGLHCAPLIHASLGTRPYGSVRASFGYGNTQENVAQLIEAVESIANRRAH